MNMENDQLHLLRTLILKSQSESLSESETNQLNELIRSEGGAHEAAVLIDQLCAFTDSRARDSLPLANGLSAALNCGEPATPVMSAPNQWTNIYWLMALVASHLFIASLAWSLAKTSPNDRSRAEFALQHSFSQQRVPRTQLVSMTACVWNSSGDMDPTVGASVQSGEVLNLVEGIAELGVGEGTPGEALVRIEGPASLFVRADGQVGLSYGTLTAKSLGTGSQSLAICTPIGEVLVDGQSSIGLVSHGTINEIHSFEGRALVKPSLIAASAPELILDEGDAVRYSATPDRDVSIVMFEASRTGFASARSSGFDPLKLGPEYVRAVLDSSPSIYWRFEELSSDEPYRVANLGSSLNMDAVVIGEPSWRQYGDNRVAELGLSTSASAFRSEGSWPPEPLDEYSIEMWVKPQVYQHGEVLCLHEIDPQEDGRHQHTMMFEITAQHFYTHRLSESLPNRFRFVHRAFGAPQPISDTSLFSEQPYQTRVWQHVVAQKQGNRQMLWVDGHLSAERSSPVPLSNKAQVLVGQVYPNSAYRRFAGQIDEVAIYDRCLSQKELRTHIKAAGRKVAAEKVD